MARYLMRQVVARRPSWPVPAFQLSWMPKMTHLRIWRAVRRNSSKQPPTWQWQKVVSRFPNLVWEVLQQQKIITWRRTLKMIWLHKWKRRRRIRPLSTFKWLRSCSSVTGDRACPSLRPSSTINRIFSNKIKQITSRAPGTPIKIAISNRILAVFWLCR